MKEARHKGANIVSPHFHEVPRVVAFIETEVERLLPRAGRVAVWRVSVNRFKVLLGEDKNVLKMGGGDSCTNM